MTMTSKLCNILVNGATKQKNTPQHVDDRGVVSHEFASNCQTVNKEYYLAVS